MHNMLHPHVTEAEQFERTAGGLEAEHGYPVDTALPR